MSTIEALDIAIFVMATGTFLLGLAMMLLHTDIAEDLEAWQRTFLVLYCATWAAGLVWATITLSNVRDYLRSLGWD